MEPWIEIAEKEKGTHEVKGGENPRIIEYHSVTNLKAQEDEVPWCAAFVCWCLEKSGFKSTKSAWARSYLNYGEKLDHPKEGAIMVFQRGEDSGHVGFYIGEDKDFFHILGGNQHDEVCVGYYAKHKLLGIRWPVK